MYFRAPLAILSCIMARLERSQATDPTTATIHDRVRDLTNQGWYVPSETILDGVPVFRPASMSGHPEVYHVEHRFIQAFQDHHATSHPVSLVMQNTTITASDGRNIPLHIPANRFVLEWAAGTAAITKYFARRYPEQIFVAMDVLPAHPTHTEYTYPFSELPENIRLAKHRIGYPEEPLPPALLGNVGMVFCHNFIDLLHLQLTGQQYHLPSESADIPQFFQDMERTLAPGALIFFGHGYKKPHETTDALHDTTRRQDMLWFAELLACSGHFDVVSLTYGDNPHLEESQLLYPTDAYPQPIFAIYTG